MSLRIWLPLNGTLDNQGLDQITVTNNGATIDNNGKIGKCYSFDGNTSGININGDIIPTLAQGDFSTSFWVYNNDEGNRSIYMATIPSSNFGLGIQKTVSEGLRIYWQGTPDYYPNLIIPVQEWCHIAVVIKSNNCYCYKNGILTASREDGSFTPQKLTNTWVYGMLGRDLRTGATVLKGKMNDFRWYDHALSPLEVKEISKGLVLHYPLTDAYVEDTLNYLGEKSDTFTSWRSYGFGSKGAITIDTTQTSVCGGQVAKLTNNTTETSNSTVEMATVFTSVASTVMQKNEKFTISAYVKGNGSTIGRYCYLHIYNTNGTNTSSTSGQPIVLTDKWQRITYTYIWPYDTASSNSGNCYIYAPMKGGESIYICNVQVEKKDHATPFTNNSRVSNIVYDCSGFCNNGIIYKYDNNGDIAIDLNTPKYLFCTHIKAGNPTEHSATGLCYIYGNCSLTTPNQLTISFWCKPIHNYQDAPGRQGVFCTTSESIGIGTGTDYNTTAMHHRDGLIDVCQNSGTQNNISTPFIVGEWHYYTFIYNGKNIQWYKDGVFQSEKAFSNADDLKSFSAIVIGFTKAGGVYRKNDCYMSDFRIYATALSADDIKSLYNNSAYIDNQGNIYGAVYEEV